MPSPNVDWSLLFISSEGAFISNALQGTQRVAPYVAGRAIAVHNGDYLFLHPEENQCTLRADFNKISFPLALLPPALRDVETTGCEMQPTLDGMASLRVGHLVLALKNVALMGFFQSSEADRVGMNVEFVSGMTAQFLMTDEDVRQCIKLMLGQSFFSPLPDETNGNRLGHWLINALAFVRIGIAPDCRRVTLLNNKTRFFSQLLPWMTESPPGHVLLQSASGWCRLDSAWSLYKPVSANLAEIAFSGVVGQSSFGMPEVEPWDWQLAFDEVLSPDAIEEYLMSSDRWLQGERIWFNLSRVTGAHLEGQEVHLVNHGRNQKAIFHCDQLRENTYGQCILAALGQ